MKVGILGSGEVAKILAGGFLDLGHSVMLSSRTPAKLTEWAEGTPNAGVGTFAEAAQFGDWLVLAINGKAATEVLRRVGAENLDGKLVIDLTNPIADVPPDHGVLKYFTSLDESLMEQLQHDFPRAHFVKAFNSVGKEYMVHPQFPDGRPTMFMCGNNEAAKHTVHEICDAFGWDTADMGGVEAARAIEPLCMLWCLPGLLRGEWGHAFKLLMDPKRPRRDHR